ncbi:MAG: hypothetical protein LBJ47_09705 [Tannerella sp.]|nr:hypothetical protein [Tannerella sp.]
MFLLTILALALYSVGAILKRLERNILEVRIPFSGDTKILSLLAAAEKNLHALPWKKRGSLALVLLLSMFAWCMDIFAYRQAGGALTEASLRAVGRILTGLGLPLDADYAVYAQPGMFAEPLGILTGILGMCWISQRILKNFPAVNGAGSGSGIWR